MGKEHSVTPLLLMSKSLLGILPFWHVERVHPSNKTSNQTIIIKMMHDYDKTAIIVTSYKLSYFIILYLCWGDIVQVSVPLCEETHSSLIDRFQRTCFVIHYNCQAFQALETR